MRAQAQPERADHLEPGLTIEAIPLRAFHRLFSQVSLSDFARMLIRLNRLHTKDIFQIKLLTLRLRAL